MRQATVEVTMRRIGEEDKIRTDKVWVSGENVSFLTLQGHIVMNAEEGDEVHYKILKIEEVKM